MATLEEAYKIVITSAKPLNVEKTMLEDSLNRVLATDVVSDMDMPPFNKSAMDGYACRRKDLKNILEVIELIPAGQAPSKTIKENQCSKIMTGAQVPEGADCVVMIEQTEEISENKIRFTVEETFDNIARRAEDVSKGETVLKKGILIQPQHIAVLAAVGCSMPLLSKQPVVSIISTGDELVEPSIKPGLSQIRNSNAYQLIAQLKKINCIPFYIGIAPDNREKTASYITEALEKSDVLILTGGVSMGDFDFIPGVLKKNKFKLLFEKLDVKPGRPTVFGVSEDKYVFGLPGNPVSSFIMFEMLVKPFLYKMMRHDFFPPSVYMQLNQGFSRKKADRLLIVPVKFVDNGKLDIVEYHGSAHINSLCNADGIFNVPKGITEIKKGEFVHVRQI